MTNVTENVCTKYRLTIKKTFGLGHKCKDVHLVVNPEGKELVLKLGTTASSIKEIHRNVAGAERLEKLGLGELTPTPKIISFESGPEYAMLLMEYCGDDFFTAVQKAVCPIDLYSRLIIGLKPLYLRSLQNGQAGAQAITSVIREIQRQYTLHVMDDFDEERRLSKPISELPSALGSMLIERYSFSNWDFTPEDVYIDASGKVRYSDAHENVSGVPIIDLACFAGVAIAYNLPGSEIGFSMLKDFAIKDVSQMFGLTETQGEKIFTLGSILQRMLSIRFRKNSNPTQATSLFKEAESLVGSVFRAH